MIIEQHFAITEMRKSDPLPVISFSGGPYFDIQRRINEIIAF